MQAALDVLPTGEVEPAGHARQVEAVVAPTVVEYWASPQEVHAAVPVVSLYLPAAQAVQTPPFGPVYPILHVQLPKAVQP